MQQYLRKSGTQELDRIYRIKAISIQNRNQETGSEGDGELIPAFLRSSEISVCPVVHAIECCQEALEGQDFPNKAELGRELKGAIDKADGYRHKADDAVKQAKASRAFGMPRLGKSWRIFPTPRRR